MPPGRASHTRRRGHSFDRLILRFDPASRQLVAAAELQGPGWLHVKDPSPEELEAVARTLKFPRAFLEHALDENEVSRVDATREGALLVVVRGPLVVKDDPKTPYRAVPFGIIVLPHSDVAVTIGHGGGDIPEVLRQQLEPATSPKRFVLEVLMIAAERFLDRLQEIVRVVEETETRLESSQRNEEVLNLLKYQKALVYFSTALNSNALMLDRLRKEPSFKLDRADHELLEDTLVEVRQAHEMASVASNILGEMMDAFASIISNNLNRVVKVLTAMTIVIAVPTMIASFYGMNVWLPLAAAPGAFAGLVLLSVAASAVMVVVLLRKRWF